ncbi:phosphotransferase family protein [soil metagenome]
MSDATVAHGLARYLSERWNSKVEISGIRQVVGGAARATWRCSADYNGLRRGLIFRVGLSNGMDLHSAGAKTEFDVMHLAFEAGTPVAEPLFYETDRQWVGDDFVIIAEIPDCHTSISALPDVSHPRLAQDAWSILGRIASLDLKKIDPSGILDVVAPESCAASQLEYWSSIYSSNIVHPDPIGAAAIRWLRTNMPLPAQKLCLVHGDYRVGNLLISENGQVEAVLDWEMAHMGDPLEDLAWSLGPRQDVDDCRLAAGIISHAQALEIWMEASGLDIDPTAFRWWQVFAAFKALAIWTKSAALYAHSDLKRPVLARIGWVLTERQQRVLAEYLSPSSSHRLFEYMQ